LQHGILPHVLSEGLKVKSSHIADKSHFGIFVRFLLHFADYL